MTSGPSSGGDGACVGAGVAVGAGGGVAVGGTGVAVGGSGVAVGGTGVAVGAGGGVAVGGTGVAVAWGACVGAGVGSGASAVQARSANRANAITMQISLDINSDPTFPGRPLRIRSPGGHRRVPLAVYVRALLPSPAKSVGLFANAASHEQPRCSSHPFSIFGARMRTRQPLTRRFASKTTPGPSEPAQLTR